MMDEVDATYREKLARQSLRWRFGIGVASWGVALAMSAFVGLVLEGVSFVHVEGTSRLVAYAVPMILSFLGAGFVLLRLGEIELSTGRLVRAAPVPWAHILAGVGAMTLGMGALIAWPLGVYTAVRASQSSCGRLVPLALAQSLTTEPLSWSYAREEDGGCDAGMSAPGRTSHAVLVRERPAPDDHEWRSLVSRFHPDRREPLTVQGADTALLLVNDEAWVIAIRQGTTGRFVQLRNDVFDRGDALTLADELSP